MNSRPIPAIALGLAVVMVLAACAAVAPPGADPGRGDWPEGRTFLSTSVTENGSPKALVKDTRIELSFHEDGRVSANAGCNTMSGAGHVRGGALVLSDLAITEMGCPGERMAQDTWLAGFLAAEPGLTLSGDELTLAGETVTIVLTDRRVVDPDRPLVGPQWVVDTIYQGEVASSVPSAVPAVLTIDPSGNFIATTGCAGGELSGRAEVSAGSVTFAVTAQTPCSDEGNSLDAAVRSVVDGARTVEITARRLRIMAPDGTGLGLVTER